MVKHPTIAARAKNRILAGTIDFPAQVSRWRRQAEEYRVLAEAANTDTARKSYVGLATDYDELAARAEETLAAAKR
jgi:hypothetical protein